MHSFSVLSTKYVLCGSAARKCRMSLHAPVKQQGGMYAHVNFASPGFDPSVLRRFGIWEAKDEAVLNTFVYFISYAKTNLSVSMLGIIDIRPSLLCINFYLAYH